MIPGHEHMAQCTTILRRGCPPINRCANGDVKYGVRVETKNRPDDGKTSDSPRFVRGIPTAICFWTPAYLGRSRGRGARYIPHMRFPPRGGKRHEQRRGAGKNNGGNNKYEGKKWLCKGSPMPTTTCASAKSTRSPFCRSHAAEGGLPALPRLPILHVVGPGGSEDGSHHIFWPR